MEKRKKRFKLIKMLSFVLFAAMLAVGCAYAEKERYMNFLADLDIINRFELCFDAAANRKTDGYTADEIEALKQDVASYENPNEDADRANEYLYKTAALLSLCIENLKINDMYNYEINLTRAREYYAQANALMSAIKEGSENV